MCTLKSEYSLSSPLYVNHLELAKSLSKMERDSIRSLHLVALLGALLFYLTGYMYLMGPNEGADSAGCRAVYMYPSWARIRSFDESHTKFASKYSLYLYREQGLDAIPTNEGDGFSVLDGIPILFIPGNAGSFRQVRSIAAGTSNLFFDNDFSNKNARNYDFFAADFNEDFTAFHGRTILDQAEYLNEASRFVLLLYENSPNPPKSVVVLGHSMGGIVGRVMPTLPNYIPGTMNTLITLASPHSAAPLTFDGDILKVYLAVDRFWHDAFNVGASIAQERLQNVSVVSITGGMLDNILPADYTTLGYLVPPTNGFTVYTTGIPQVWTPMDHLAIVWCHQLRRLVLKMLLEIADINSPQRTYPLEKRMSIMRQILLTGFEEYSQQDSAAHAIKKDPGKHIAMKFDVLEMNWLSGSNVVHKFSLTSQNHTTLFRLSGDSVFLMLSSFRLSPWESLRDNTAKSPSLFLCLKGGEASYSLDFTKPSTNEYMNMTCVDVSLDERLVPRSSKTVKSLTESSYGGVASPFYAYQFGLSILSGYDYLVVVENPSNHKKGEFSIAQLSGTQYNLGKNLFSLITHGADISLGPDRPLAVNLHIPGAWSSILAYRLKIKGIGNGENSFEPFIRQWRDDPFESKWHINLRENKEILISMHGIAPFTPFTYRNGSYGMNLELWTDPQSGPLGIESKPVEITLSVDWVSSLRLLVMRYRLAVVSHGLAVTVLVMIFQFLKYHETGKFPDYIYGLNRLVGRNVFGPILLLLALFTVVAKFRPVQIFLDLIDPVVLQDPNEINISLHEDFKLNAFYLGLEESTLWFVGCLFLIMAVGINFMLYYSLVSLGYAIVFIAKMGRRWIPAQEKPPVKENKVWASRKLIGTAIILVLVPFYMPYQFAYMICFAIQAITVIKLMIRKASKSVWNFHMAVLMTMLWVLPINVPVLIVFVHNFNINWATPFSSHHNFLAIAPILAMVEIHSFNCDLMPIAGPNEKNERLEKRKCIYVKVTVGILTYMVIYSLIYGIRHTYWLHHLFNFWSCWILVMYIEQIAKLSHKPK